MTLRVNFLRAVLKVVLAVLLILAAAAVYGRWQNGHWPERDFYLSFIPAFILVPIAALLVVVPKNITLTEDSLTIVWPFRRTVSSGLDELEYFMQARLFMIQFESAQTQLIDPGGFRRREWRAFVRELESRFPDRKAQGHVGFLMFGRRKP
jgi:hypothetical protein